jgi:signal transduction histidine kinase
MNRPSVNSPGANLPGVSLLGMNVPGVNLPTADLQPTGPMVSLLIRIGRGPTSARRQWVIISASIGTILLLGFADVLTGPNVHLGQLYIIPVLFAAWYAGRWPGYLVGFTSILIWLKVTTLLRTPQPGAMVAIFGPSARFEVTNLLIRAVVYTGFVELLVLLRGIGRQLEQTIRDRTAELRQQVEDRLRAEGSLRKLAGQLSAAEDAERRRIAYDIHDALSQMLGLVKMNLETVLAETATDAREFDRLTDVIKMVNELIRQTREMTFDLHPSMLDHFGLVPTLQRFAQEYNRRTLAEVGVTESGSRVALPSSVASYLFRAIKELINNAVRHGNAREIIVAFHWESAVLRAVIDDDGCGFDSSKALAPQARRGLGLAGIDERLTSLGGKMRLESSAGSGTRVVLELPVGAISDALAKGPAHGPVADAPLVALV